MPGKAERYLPNYRYVHNTETFSTVFSYLVSYVQNCAVCETFRLIHIQ